MTKAAKGKAKPPAKAKPSAKAKAKPAPAKKAAPSKAAPSKAAPSKAAPSKAPLATPGAAKAAPSKAAPSKAAKAAPSKAPLATTGAAKAAPSKAPLATTVAAKAAGNAGATTGTAPAKAPKAPKPAPSSVDDGWSDVETSAPRPPAQASLPLPTGVTAEHRAKVAQLVLQLYQSTVDPDAELPNALAFDPNDFDVDPSPFYEALEETFKVEDPSKHAFAGYGGTLKQTIDFIAARWK